MFYNFNQTNIHVESDNIFSSVEKLRSTEVSVNQDHYAMPIQFSVGKQQNKNQNLCFRRSSIQASAFIFCRVMQVATLSVLGSVFLPPDFIQIQRQKAFKKKQPHK